MSKQNQEMTGYPSIDRPWMKYYTKESQNLAIPCCSAYEYLKEKSSTRLKNVAIRYFNRKITYSELLKMIDIVADSLFGIGIQKGDVVVIALPNIPENVILFYALNKLGAIADFIDLRKKGDELVYFINETEAKIFIGCTMFIHNVLEVAVQTALQNIIVVSPYNSLPFPLNVIMIKKEVRVKYTNCIKPWSELIRLSKKHTAPNVFSRPEDVVCILHTSGTTGISKGAMMTNYGFNAMAVQHASLELPYSEGDLFLNQVPPFLAFNILNAVHDPLIMGLQIVMIPEYNPERFAENIIRLKINHALAGPADWKSFLILSIKKKWDVSFLKTAISGSDSFNTEDKEKVNRILKEHGFQGKILEGYGMTEVGAAFCVNRLDSDVEESVGIPIPLNSVCIYDGERKKECQYNEIGEICMYSPTMMKGYYNLPQETSLVLKKHSDGKVWMHSGDLGIVNENGFIFLKGRLKRIIIRYDGQKVSPYNIEQVVRSSPLVENCCVVGILDVEHGMGQVPVIFAVPVDKKWDNDALSEILLALCRSQLTEKEWPKECRFVQQLPLTPNGKVDYRALEEA